MREALAGAILQKLVDERRVFLRFDFIQQALVPMSSETHGGEDLGIYAIGPWSHLFQGTVEENYTFHVMDYASKISERAMAAANGGQSTTKKAQAN